MQTAETKMGPKKRHAGMFKPGHKPKATRQPGQANRMTRDIKQGIVDAAEMHGSDGKGKDGLTGYLFHLAKKHPKAFSSLIGKTIPLQVNARVGTFIGSVNIVSVPTERFLTADDIARIDKPGNGPAFNVIDASPVDYAVVSPAAAPAASPAAVDVAPAASPAAPAVAAGAAAVADGPAASPASWRGQRPRQRAGAA